MGEFTERDVKRSLEDLETLEGLFLEVLRDHASNAIGRARKVLHDVVAHGQRSDTPIGTEVDRAVTRAWDTIGKSGRAAPIAGAQGLRRSRPGAGARWHLDKIFVSINGKRMYLWRAVDSEG